MINKKAYRNSILTKENRDAISKSKLKCTQNSNCRINLKCTSNLCPIAEIYIILCRIHC